MFIQTEQTPNPETLKFLPGREVMPSGTANFPDLDSAQASPLARELFKISGVSAIFFGSDFITVSKTEGDWQELKPVILGSIMEFFMSGKPIIDEAEQSSAPGASIDDEADSELVAQIKELLDTRVRPAVARDGGDIVYHGFKEGIVYLHMQGACAGCPSSTATLKGGIENLLRHYVPEVTEVRAI